MGIQGLLPLLKECQEASHIKEFKGQTLAIDAYVWLHRGAYGCAQEIATGQQTVKYVKYAMHRIRLLRHFGVTPFVVIDGGLLPSKMGTETDRESRRNEALSKANALVVEGKAAQARDFYVKAVDVTPQMAYQLIKALIAEDVAYIVAPYEADAQLAYLEKKGIVDGIITEDSDLLVFGCKQVLFKLDGEGTCTVIRRDNFTRCKEFSFSGWTDAEFRQMAILSGCDYLDSIQGLGIKTSHRLMRKYKTADKVIKFLRLEGQLRVPRNYDTEFRRAEWTFLHQRVFCPEAGRLVHLEPLPAHLGPQSEALRYVGEDLAPEIAQGVARGELCPMSKAKMVDIAPNADVLAAQPGQLHAAAAAAVAATADKSIKDYFKRAPPAQKKPTRPALRERNRSASTSNLFSTSVKKEGSPAPGGPLVKSRFFFAGVGSGATSVSKLAGPSTSSGNLGTASGPGNSPTEPLVLDEEEMEEDAQVFLLAETMSQAADAQALDAEDLSDTEAALKASSDEQDKPALPRSSTPTRPTSPREPLSDAGFSHISSPGNASQRGSARKRGSPARQAKFDDSGFDENLPESDQAPFLSSPRLSGRGAGKVKVERVSAHNGRLGHASSQDPINLSDLSSPEAGPSKARERAGRTIAAKLEPLRSPGRKAIQGRPKRRSDSIESSWTSDPITPDEDGAGFTGAGALENSGAQADERSRGARAGSGSQGKVRKPPRPAKRKSRELTSEEIEEERVASMEMDSALSSVVAGWRAKYSNPVPGQASAAKRKRMSLGSTPSSRAPLMTPSAHVAAPSAGSEPKPPGRSESTLVPASPTRVGSAVSTSRLQARVRHSYVTASQQARRAASPAVAVEFDDDDAIDDHDDDLSPAALVQAAAFVSTSTTRKLESFRCRPSPFPAS